MFLLFWSPRPIPLNTHVAFQMRDLVFVTLIWEIENGKCPAGSVFLSVTTAFREPSLRLVGHNTFHVAHGVHGIDTCQNKKVNLGKAGNAVQHARVVTCFSFWMVQVRPDGPHSPY